MKFNFIVNKKQNLNKNNNHWLWKLWIFHYLDWFINFFKINDKWTSQSSRMQYAFTNDINFINLKNNFGYWFWIRYLKFIFYCLKLYVIWSSLKGFIKYIICKSKQNDIIIMLNLWLEYFTIKKKFFCNFEKFNEGI